MFCPKVLPFSHLYRWAKGGRLRPSFHRLFCLSIRDTSKVLWGTCWGTHWDLEDHIGKLMGTRWELKGNMCFLFGFSGRYISTVLLEISLDFSYLVLACSQNCKVQNLKLFYFHILCIAKFGYTVWWMIDSSAISQIWKQKKIKTLVGSLNQSKTNQTTNG
jgi:hypothetical protein